MKYPNIAATLGWEETPDLAEGIHLQPEEAAKLDTDLGTSSAASQAQADALVVANSTIAERDATVTTLNGTVEERDLTISGVNTRVGEMETAAQTATETIAARDQRIQELEGQVAKLGKQSSGKGTVIGAREDEVVTEGSSAGSSLPKFDSPDHPANMEADKYTRRKV